MALVDDRLDDWSTVQGAVGWQGLLLGNGASIAISKKFRYSSLLGHAALSPEAVGVFRSMSTDNFELVLDGLRVSAQVCDATGHGRADADSLHEEVRDSLFAAVNDVHPEHHEVTGLRLDALSDEMRRYSWTWTTNYDLLPYWATMDAGSGIKDFFWGSGGTFDSLDTDLWGRALLFLHGGVHLYLDTASGLSGKWTGVRLLDVSRQTHPTRSPLLISEATSADKMRSIRRSDYLSFAYRSLVDFERPLVVFGHGLAENDGHIVEAINKHPSRPIGYSVYPGGGLDVVALKTRVQLLLPNRKIYFFDSRTHPLGASTQTLP